MNDPDIGAPAAPRNATTATQPGFLRRNARAIVLWPAAALLLACLLWGAILSILDRDHDRIRDEASRQAGSLARAYAVQLERTVGYIDQLSLRLKHDWEDPYVILNLERQQERGLYPDNEQLYASVADGNGDVVTSTLPLPNHLSFATHPNFLEHKAGESGLLLAGPEASKRLGVPVIRFTRRLEDIDGNFAGMAIVSAQPAFLGTFYDEAVLGSGDFVSVRYSHGAMLAVTANGRTSTGQQFYRDDPAFGMPAGTMVAEADRFRDGQSRIVAWKQLDRYPLVAVAALSEKQVYAAYHATARRYFALATAGSLFLFLFASIGMALSARLAWRRQKEHEVRETYRLAVDAAKEGFYMLRPLHDANGAITDFQVADCNERAAALVGMSKAEFIGRTVTELHAEDYAYAALERMRLAMEEGYYEDEVRVSSRSMLKVDWVHRKLVRSGAGLAMTVRDISEIKAHEQELTNMANADALTTLPNRHWLTNYLPVAIEQAHSNRHNLAVLFIDLDDFKNINDTLGHVAGDELLKAAADRLRSLVRGSDRVVRLGGDEFTIVLDQVRRVDDVARVARLIIEALGEPFTVGHSSGHRVHASIGISMYPQDGQDGETLLKHADVAMYAAKAAGKGRYQFYQSHLSDRLVLRINREQALRQAIERDEFVLHYQPRVDAATGKMVSMEALVRWQHPERGLVPPIEFIEVAEDTGLILQLGRIVIEKACAQIAQWKAEGLPIVPVSINVSALQFNEGHVSDFLARSMRRYDVDPSLVGVELTESCMAGQDDTVTGELDGLRRLGVKLLVDDFGTGYSSLSQLQRLNVDILKVDRAFTVTLCDGAEGKALFKAIVSMADALDISIVAEGVETEEQLHALQMLECDEVQGHFVSRPVPATEMAALMIKRFLFPEEISHLRGPLPA
ncbi:bifunctional diguanylate cyclase/phosphodiesterase [Noviherbaspirillum sp. ST9]|uniref:bifunctional diguanylate cyclase/phosphodiesterase n=1 Tax=Noviherbaspirillum sp. ST9 TaxID=3401606 RepID=UPI003B586B25